jgi:modulator of FtsH protease HflC
MSEDVTAAQSRSGPALRRTLVVLLSVAAIVAAASSLLTVDVTEYAVVTRFGRVVGVLAEPGLYVTAPFDRAVRVDKRVLFSQLARSEYLTTDKKNVVVETLATWRIAEPQRFLSALGTRAAAEERLSDAVLAEIGAVVGRYPVSVLVSADPGESRYRAIWSEIRHRVAGFARPAYGIELIGLELRRLSLPEQNREHVFDRMKAERARIAKENRSRGELEAKKVIAEAEHEKTLIDAEAAGEATRIRAEGDAEASRTYAAAFGRDPSFYEFLRTLRAYGKILDDKTTLFLPPDADMFRMLDFDTRPMPAPSSPAPPPGVSTGADLLLQHKSEGRAQ